MNVALSSYFTLFPDCRHVIMKYPYEYIRVFDEICDNNPDFLSIKGKLPLI